MRLKSSLSRREATRRDALFIVKYYRLADIKTYYRAKFVSHLAQPFEERFH